jgi:hypothetical protein
MLLLHPPPAHRQHACYCLLALNLAHSQSKYGDLPLEETLVVINTRLPNDEQAKLLANGMENLVGVLGAVCSDLYAPRH